MATIMAPTSPPTSPSHEKVASSHLPLSQQNSTANAQENGNDPDKPPDLIVQPSTPSKSHPAPTRKSTTTLLSRTSSAQNGKDKESKSLKQLPSTPPPGAHALDPLSNVSRRQMRPKTAEVANANCGQQIFLRTNSNTEPSIAQRLLNSNRPESPNPDGVHKQSLESPQQLSSASPDVFKDRKKGSSFLSRLSIRGLSRREDVMHDSDSELGDLRTDGNNARAMTMVMGAGGGYIPLHKEPPRYIRVKPNNKKTRTFNRLFLAQELQGTRASMDDGTPGRTPAIAVGTKLLKANGAAIWAAEFSQDGKYLAVAGKDQVIRIFAVISTPEERQAQEEDEELAGTGGSEKLSAPVFLSTPAREFEGHGGDVLALCWSKNNFLLSSSMDKTVKLWHMSRDDCLCTFTHDDLVTSIAFHPTDDRFFLAGSLDAQLRLWSIPEKEVAFSVSTTEFITAVAFSPDGKIAICGLLTGLCNFYDTEQLKLKYQIHVRSSRGRNAKGSKITGIRTLNAPSKDGATDGEVKVLITSNDSRLRIYTLKDRMLEVKLKGLENQSSQIHARFSDDGRFIVCGSEDRKAYLWNLADTDVELKDKQPYECFDAHPEVVTTALMAPVQTKQLLSASGDPIYDLCNPPPVQLVCLDEQQSSRSVTTDGDKGDRNSGTGLRKPEESPAYIERTKHQMGHIVVTTDRTGTIKVFRQDCAFAKRQQNLWETGSKFSGKIAGVGRSGSVVTRTSGGSRIHSRRGSINLGQPLPAAQHASDRIMSWRQDVEGGRASTGSAANRSERSVSPMKLNRSPMNASAATLASEARRQPYVGSPAARSSKPTSPTSSIRAVPHKKGSGGSDGPSLPPTPSFNLISASEQDQQREEKSDSFWNLTLPRWKGLPSLRYSSTTGSLPTEIGEGTQGTALRPTGSTSATSGGSRRSFAVGDIKRLKEEESVHRRRSTGASIPAKVAELTEAAATVKEEPDSTDRRPSATKRSDSGVGKMSSDSNA